MIEEARGWSDVTTGQGSQSRQKLEEARGDSFSRDLRRNSPADTLIGALQDSFWNFGLQLSI